MNIYRFDRDAGVAADQFDSSGVTLSRILATSGLARMASLHLEPQGQIGEHPCGEAELFLVVRGDGWISEGDGERVPVRSGQAVFWAKGKRRCVGTGEGMTAIVVSGDSVEPRRFLSECVPDTD